MARESRNAAQEAAAQQDKLPKDTQEQLAKRADAAMDASAKADTWSGEGTQRELKFADNRQLELDFGMPEGAKVVDSEDGVLTIEGTDKDGKEAQILQTEERVDSLERAAMYLDAADAAMDLNFAPGVPGTELAKNRLQDLVTKVFSSEPNKVKAVEMIHKTAEKMADLKEDGVEMLYAKLLWGDWTASNLDSGELKDALAGLEYEEADIDDFETDIREVADVLQDDTTPQQRQSAGRKLLGLGLEVAKQLVEDLGNGVIKTAKAAQAKGMEALTDMISGAVDLAYGKDMDFDLGDLGMALMSPKPSVEKIDAFEAEVQQLNKEGTDRAKREGNDVIEEYSPDDDEAVDEAAMDAADAELEAAMNDSEPNATEIADMEKARQKQEADEAGVVFKDVPEIAVNEAQFNKAFNDSRELARQLREADPAAADALGTDYLEKMQPGVYLDADDSVKAFEGKNFFKRMFAKKEQKIAYQNAKETVSRIDAIRDQLRVTGETKVRSPLGVDSAPSDVANPYGVSFGKSPERMKQFAPLGEKNSADGIGYSPDQLAEQAAVKETMDTIMSAKELMKDKDLADHIAGNPELLDLLALDPADYVQDQTTVDKAGFFGKIFSGKVRKAKKNLAKMDRLMADIQYANVDKVAKAPVPESSKKQPQAIGAGMNVNFGGGGSRMETFSKPDTREPVVNPEAAGEMGERLKDLQEFIKEDVRLNQHFYKSETGMDVLKALGLNGNEIVAARSAGDKKALGEYQNILAIAERRRSIIQESSKYTNFHKQWESMKQYIEDQLEEDPGGAFSGELAEANNLTDVTGQDFLLADADDRQKTQVSKWKRLAKQVNDHRKNNESSKAPEAVLKKDGSIQAPAAADAPEASGLDAALAEAEAAKAEADAEAALDLAELEMEADLPEPLAAEMPRDEELDANADLPEPLNAEMPGSENISKSA
jgi:hypothetical protein